MPIDVWIAFTIASAILIMIPGPTVMMVVSYALSKGREVGWASVAAVVLGDFVAVTISLAGAGAILAASATLFTILKLSGAFYLMWLGIKLWMTKAEPTLLLKTDHKASRKDVFLNTLLVTALNPKSILFFVAFVPQFISSSAPVMPQMIVLTVTFCMLGGMNAFMWAFLGHRMRRTFSSVKRLTLVNRIGGSFMITAGLITALSRKA